ncbi:MAG: LCP family protein [Lachnospiraceae bacterium]|nr:LCP family protein [Lachnospiraceae bacterium]
MNEHDNKPSETSDELSSTTVNAESVDDFDVDWNTVAESVKSSSHHRHRGIHGTRRHRRHHRHHRHHHHDSSRLSVTNGAERAAIAGSQPDLAMVNSEITFKEDIKSAPSSDYKHRRSPKKKNPLWLKILLGILIFVICLILTAVIVFFILRQKGKSEMHNYKDLNVEMIDGASTLDNGSTIEYKGHTYTFNTDITTVLFLGIDNESDIPSDDIIGANGQADSIYLLVYDTVSGKSKVISFSRDSMVDINTYDTSGNFAGTTNAQLCLSYAYGDGNNKSAQNVVTSVQRLMFNVPIMSYLAIDIDAIKILNDDVGGVTVTPASTFAGDFIQGQTITLKGDQAEKYVRYRETEELASNSDRMARQQQYITAFANQIVPSIRKDVTVPVDLFNHASEYTVTDLNSSRITYLASSIATTYSGLEFISAPGKVKLNKKTGYAEYIIDYKAMYDIILDTFYTQVN